MWLGAMLGAQQQQRDPHTAHGQPRVSHTGEVPAAVGKSVEEGLKCLSKSGSCVVTQKQGICRFWYLCKGHLPIEKLKDLLGAIALAGDSSC